MADIRQSGGLENLRIRGKIKETGAEKDNPEKGLRVFPNRHIERAEY